MHYDLTTKNAVEPQENDGSTKKGSNRQAKLGCSFLHQHLDLTWRKKSSTSKKMGFDLQKH